MNSEKIYDALTNMRDDFITEAREGRRKKVHFRTLLMTAILIVLASGTALAVWLLRSPGEAARNSPRLAEILGCEDAVMIEEVTDIGDYRVTLLGTAPGRSLSKLDITNIQANKTYVITAVQKLDGDDMPPFASNEYAARPFYTHAFIQGVPPWQFRATDSVEAVILDGIQFMLTCSEDLEPFADRGAFLTVSHGSYTPDAYRYDADTGALARIEDYEGVNALFKLPLDPSKADPARAAEILRGHEPEPFGTEPPPVIETDDNGDFVIPDDLRTRGMLGTELLVYYIENYPERFTLREDLVRECTVADGFIQYENDFTFEGSSSSGSGNVPLDMDAFKENPLRTISGSTHWHRYEEGTYTIEHDVLYLDQDGVIWFQVYTLTSDEIPREVIEGYRRRLLAQE